MRRAWLSRPGVRHWIAAGRKEGNMPNYPFECQKCRKTFTVTLTFKEYDQHKVKCPKCGSASVQQLLSAIFAKTAKKS
jgi:putative FmdB family regulatory protein